MNKKFLLLALALVISASTASYAKTSEQEKARKETIKQARKNLDAKVGKDAKKEAKQYKKDGWKVSPGALPMEKQLDRAYLMQNEFDADGYLKYIVGEGRSLGGNYDAAKVQALEMAKLDVIRQAESEISTLIKNTVENDAGNFENVNSSTFTELASRNYIEQHLGRVIPIVELNRTVNGNYEVLVKIAYSMELLEKDIQKRLRDDLRKRGDQLQDELKDMNER